MYKFLSEIIANKNIAILGFGREGKSTYRLLRKYFPELSITIADANSGLKENLGIDDPFLVFKTGLDYLSEIENFDLVFKTPGITLKSLDFRVPKEKILSQTDVFLQFYSKQIIGVTGTKGKSTTSSLIYNILQKSGRDALLVGNIGLPPFEVLNSIRKDTTIVYELSSHQLEVIRKAPHIAILLNLFQEHLDNYISFEAYQQAKFNITAFQDKNDYLIYYKEDKLINNLINHYALQRNYLEYSLVDKVKNGTYLFQNQIYFKNGPTAEPVLDINSKRKLKGDHNLLNIMAAINACKMTGINNQDIANNIQNFNSLPHRLEFVGNIDGILYYNDSIATIPEATIQAIKTLKNVDTLILGGFDRGINYQGLIDFIKQSSIRNIILTGKAGKRMCALFSECNAIQNYQFADNYIDIVKIAKKVTLPSRICLLSPAASSYDQFKNFEQRGNYFKELIDSL